MQYIHFRDLVGVAYTEEEAKAMAAEVRGGSCDLSDLSDLEGAAWAIGVAFGDGFCYCETVGNVEGVGQQGLWNERKRGLLGG
jgi:hypothetical protein